MNDVKQWTFIFSLYYLYSTNTCCLILAVSDSIFAVYGALQMAPSGAK